MESEIITQAKFRDWYNLFQTAKDLSLVIIEFPLRYSDHYIQLRPRTMKHCALFLVSGTQFECFSKLYFYLFKTMLYVSARQVYSVFYHYWIFLIVSKNFFLSQFCWPDESNLRVGDFPPQLWFQGPRGVLFWKPFPHLMVEASFTKVSRLCDILQLILFYFINKTFF